MAHMEQVQELREMTGRINEIVTAHIRSQILVSALESGVFPLLEEDKTAEEAAAALEWSPRGVRMLLDGLVALELVEQRNGRYRNARIASVCLVPGRPGYQGHIIRHNQHGWPAWSRLKEAVASGAAVSQHGPQRSNEELRDFILGMKDIAQFSAQEVLDAVDLSQYRRLLDLGGGPATYAIAFLRRHAEMRATVFDHPDVIAIAREQVAEANLEDRIVYLGGDMTVDPIGAGYDLILVSNVIHSFGPGTNKELVRKCFDALEPAGHLIIKDFLVENDRSGPAFGLLFALRMLLNTAEGDTYTFADVGDWTREAGFSEGTVVSLTPQTRLWMVDKP